MRPTTQEDLEKFHDAIMEACKTYQPPRHLFGKMDANFMEYMNGAPAHRYYWYLALAVRFFQPESILELGTAAGASSIMMYSELPRDTTLISADIGTDGHFLPDTIRDDSRTEFITADANDRALYDHLKGRGSNVANSFDFLFLDTDHVAKDLRNQLALVGPLLRPGALVVLDDIHMNDMTEAWDEIPCPKLDITQDCHPSGFGVFIWSGE